MAHDVAPFTQQAPAAKRNWFVRHKVVTGVGAFLVLAAIGGAMGGGKGSNKPAASSAPTTGTSQAAPVSSATAPLTNQNNQVPANQAPVTTPAAPTMTAGETEAVAQANEYLSNMAFSRQGLIAQLDSPYGGQFSVADATYAADHIGADWNTEASQAAKQYLSNMAFSYNGLVQQMDSPYGGQFTLAQAEYGAHAAGLS
jgi:hypothetical protein